MCTRVFDQSFTLKLRKHSRLYPVLASSSPCMNSVRRISILKPSTLPFRYKPSKTVAWTGSSCSIVASGSHFRHFFSEEIRFDRPRRRWQAQQVARESNAIADFPIQTVNYSLPRKWSISVTPPRLELELCDEQLLSLTFACPVLLSYSLIFCSILPHLLFLFRSLALLRHDAFQLYFLIYIFILITTNNLTF